MKFFEPVNKLDKSRGYVRLDIRGVKGNIIVSVENLGDVKTTSEVFLYKDRNNKIKLGDINNKKGMIKKLLTFGSNNAIEDYNICAVVKDKKIVMYSNLFNASSLEQVKKLEVDVEDDLIAEVSKFEEVVHEPVEPVKIVKTVKTEPATTTEPVESNKAPVEDAEPKKEVSESIDEFKGKDKIVQRDEVIEENENKESEEPEVTASSENSRIKKTSVSSAVDMNKVNEEQQKEEPEAQAQSHKFRNRFDENLYNVLKDYKQVEPLSVKIKNFDWWYIPYDETGIKNGFLPYYNQIISSYYPYPMSNRVTTCAGLMKKYRHYIFGVYKEKGEIVKFVYGIPGEFTKEEQPYKGVTGFKNWSYGNKENNDKYGYWLAFVNPKTGETTEPPQIVLS